MRDELDDFIRFMFATLLACVAMGALATILLSIVKFVFFPLWRWLGII